MYYSFPALLLAWERDLGWSKAELSGAFTVALVTSAFLAPMVGRIIDRGYGTHIFILGGVMGPVTQAATIAALIWGVGGYDLVIWFAGGAAVLGLTSLLTAATLSTRRQPNASVAH
jgi:hypothetical protein